MAEKVQCAWCANFERGHGAPEALGRCGGVSWDGHDGQWPFQHHSCRDFRDSVGEPIPGASSSIKDARFYITELRSEGCRCGRGKKSGHSFCYRCYARLPVEHKNGVWRRMGSGYEEGYEAAAAYLEQEDG